MARQNTTLVAPEASFRSHAAIEAEAYLPISEGSVAFVTQCFPFLRVV